MTSENKQTAWSDWLNSWRSNKQTNCVAVGFILASDWLKSYRPIMKHIGKKITAVPNYVRHNWKLLQQTPTQISECIALNKFPLQFQFMKTTVTSAVMAENFSCATREAVLSATTGIASAGLLQPVGSGFVRGTSVMTVVNGPPSCAPNARILTVERMRLVKSQK